MEKKPTKKNQGKSHSKNTISPDRTLRKHLPEITDIELKKLKNDESYKQGFLLAVSLVTSDLKTLVYKR